MWRKTSEPQFLWIWRKLYNIHSRAIFLFKKIQYTKYKAIHITDENTENYSWKVAIANSPREENTIQICLNPAKIWKFIRFNNSKFKIYI